ncbi:MAG: hypothetical protein MUE41_09955 [Gemmatimonadaceae bacterium]|nr:hypothetical protein [Gemmatimonadaceae bacterium]
MNRPVPPGDAARWRARVGEALRQLLLVPPRAWRDEPVMSDREQAALVRAAVRAVRQGARRRRRPPRST